VGKSNTEKVCLKLLQRVSKRFIGPLDGSSFDYKNRETIFQLKVGGCVDKEFAKGTRIAAGIYYDYINRENEFSWQGGSVEEEQCFFDHSSYPDQIEYRLTLKLLGEKEICPVVTMRMGLNFSYGWGKGRYKFDASGSIPDSYMDDIPFDGSGWGIGAWLGSTVKFQRFSLELFLGGGYQTLKLRGTSINLRFVTPAQAGVQ